MLVDGITRKPTPFTFNVQRLKAFFPRSETRQKCLFLSLVIKVLEVLFCVIKKGNTHREIKWSLFTNNMILYMENMNIYIYIYIYNVIKL